MRYVFRGQSSVSASAFFLAPLLQRSPSEVIPTEGAIVRLFWCWIYILVGRFLPVQRLLSC